MNKISVLLRHTILIVASCFAFQKSVAQSTDPGVLGKVTIASPNAAALGKYIDFPVNNHTGIPQINVQVYGLQEGPLAVPISISYHASGLRLDEMSSWVGAGWSLNAGGVITRTVRGTPDEFGVAEFGKNDKGHLSHSGYNNYLFKSEAQSPLPSQDVAYMNDFLYGIRDGEPDLYFFNFNGHTGKFYFNDDGRPVLLPESDYRIEYTPGGGSGTPESIQKFTITTIDGTKYHFGKTDAPGDVDPVEKTHNYYTGTDGLFYAGTNNTISSWFLNKIESADGLFSISFTYVAEQYSYRSISGVSKSSGDYSYTSGTNWKEYGHWVQGVRLSSINTLSNNATITFTPGAARQDLSDWQAAGTQNDVVNADAKSLGAIQVSNSSGLCKKYTFTYNYFVSDPAGFPGVNAFTDLKRLKLEQIKEESCDGLSSVPPHVFEYFTESIPRRLSFAKDHWGFINGKVENLNLTPGYTVKAEPAGAITEVFGADRDSYWPAMRAGSLKKITYPTGGFTEFEFEANTAYVNYNTYTKTPRLTFAMGFDCNASTVYQTFNFSSNPYSVKLINGTTGGTSYFNCTSSLLYASAEPGQTTYGQGIPGAGSQQVWLSKPNLVSCSGTTATIYEWVPTNVSENRIVGGMRIKKITHNDGGANPNMITEYGYNESNGNSSGRLYSRPTYVQFVRNDFLRDAGLYACCQPGTFYCSSDGYEFCTTTGGPINGGYLISPNSLRPMETTQGNHIGYNEVKVFSSGNGHSVYRYYGSNVWDLILDDVAYRVLKTGYLSAPVPNFPGEPPAPDFKRGEIKYDGHFNQSGQLLKEAYYYYDYTENPVKTPALTISSGTWITGLPTFYEVSTSKRVKATIQQRVLQPGVGYMETNTENYYSSNFHNQITRKVETSSKGEQLETKYKYAADFKPDYCTSIDNGVGGYETSCASCLSQYYSNRAATGHNTAYWKYWDYQALLKCRSLARITFFNARKNYFNPSVSGSFAQCMANAKAAANAELKPLFELQERFINAPIEITSWKNGGLISAAFTKYEYSSNLPTMVYPVKLQKENLPSPSTSFIPATISGNGLSKDALYADEMTIKTENGNVVEALSKDGITTSYLWGYGNTLPIAKAVGVNYAILSTAYSSVGQNLSQLRTYSTLLNAYVSTYVYTPGIGMISETDPRGRTTYYEYDKLNRLVVVRDHDNKVVKKICYNYAGQQENCLSPCTNTSPYWQNTTTALRCQQGSCGNTGYQEQEQMDMNPCSPGYNTQTQWVVAGYNPSACPPASGVNITYQNEASVSGFTAVYTNSTTGQIYTFNVPASGTGILGCLPAARYTLSISKPGNMMLLLFGTGCFTQSGTSAYFSSVVVSSTSCNLVTMANDY